MANSLICLTNQSPAFAVIKMTDIYSVRYSNMKYAWCVYKTDLSDPAVRTFVSEHGKHEQEAIEEAQRLSSGEIMSRELNTNRRDWE